MSKEYESVRYFLNAGVDDAVSIAVYLSIDSAVSRAVDSTVYWDVGMSVSMEIDNDSRI